MSKTAVKQDLLNECLHSPDVIKLEWYQTTNVPIWDIHGHVDHLWPALLILIFPMAI